MQGQGGSGITVRCGRRKAEVLAGLGGPDNLVGTELASMRRYAGQKALYEAIARTKAKSQRRGILDLLHPGNSRVEQEEPASAPTVVEEPPKVVVVEELEFVCTVRMR